MLSGVFATATSDEATLRAVLGITEDRFEERNSSAVGYTLDNSFPKSITESTLRTVNYYDDYDFPHADDNDMAFLSSRTKLNEIKGEVTGSLTRNLSAQSGAASRWLRSVIYYDEQYRPITAN